MEKEIIDGWHRNCAEDLPEMEEYVMCVFAKIDKDGNFVATEDCAMSIGRRTEDEYFETDEFGWEMVSDDYKVAFWYRIPAVPEKFVDEIHS